MSKSFFRLHPLLSPSFSVWAPASCFSSVSEMLTHRGSPPFLPIVLSLPQKDGDGPLPLCHFQDIVEALQAKDSYKAFWSPGEPHKFLIITDKAEELQRAS